MTRKRQTTAAPDMLPLPPGPRSLFRRKIRKPVTVTMTPEHHVKINRAMKRLGCSRADVLGLLVDKYADDLET